MAVMDAVMELVVTLDRDVEREGASLSRHGHLFSATSIQGRSHSRNGGEDRKEKRGDTME